MSDEKRSGPFVNPDLNREANEKMKELSAKVPVDVPRDVKGRPLKGRPGRLSRQASKINLGFDKTPAWNEDVLLDEIYADYRVNVANILDEKARPSFQVYLIQQVLPTLIKRYSDLLNSAMHHEIAIEANRDIAPLTKKEVEKNREILDKSTEAVIKYLRRHGLNNIGELESKWKEARNWLVEVIKVLPGGEGVYRKA